MSEWEEEEDVLPAGNISNGNTPTHLEILLLLLLLPVVLSVCFHVSSLCFCVLLNLMFWCLLRTQISENSSEMLKNILQLCICWD